MVQRILAVIVFAALTTSRVASADTREPAVHNYPFFPEAMRPAMEWVDRAAQRDDPFLRYGFRSVDAPATTNRTSVRDALVGYTGPSSANGGPADGAAYYFLVGKDTWHVVYDPVHRMAYYGEGCCSYHREVLVRVHTTAPRSVPRRDLSTMRTARGMRLGMTVAQVERREGPAPRTMGPTGKGRTALAYWSRVGKQCSQERTFVFVHDRLQAIHVVEGC